MGGCGPRLPGREEPIDFLALEQAHAEVQAVGTDVRAGMAVSYGEKKA